MYMRKREHHKFLMILFASVFMFYKYTKVKLSDMFAKHADRQFDYFEHVTMSERDTLSTDKRRFLT